MSNCLVCHIVCSPKNPIMLEQLRILAERNGVDCEDTSTDNETRSLYYLTHWVNDPDVLDAKRQGILQGLAALGFQSAQSVHEVMERRTWGRSPSKTLTARTLTLSATPSAKLCMRSKPT